MSEIKLQAVGDIGLHGGVLKTLRARRDGYPFESVRARLADADIVFGNLEIPLLDSEEEGRCNPVVPSTLLATVEGAPRLRSAGFHVLSLANNHVLDHGAEGLRSTLRALAANGLGVVGAGENLESARKPLILERNGMRAGFLAYTLSRETWASESAPGAAPMRDALVEEDIRALRSKVDVLAVSLHFGLMYTDYPRRNDQARLRRYVDAGADLILGHHPHVCQGIEPYGRGLIAYSLGEFVFDPHAGNVLATRFLSLRTESMILRCRFGAKGLSGWDFLPVRIGPDLAPVPAEGDDAAKIAGRINDISKPLEADGLSGFDLEAHAGSILVGHEARVLWYNLRHLNLVYLLSKLRNLQPRHFRMLLAGVRHRLTRTAHPDPTGAPGRD